MSVSAVPPRPSRRWAYSSNGLTRRSLLESVGLIAQAGYQGIELLADAPHWQPTSLTDPTWKMYDLGCSTQDLRQALHDYGLWVSNVNANTAMFCWPRWMPETVFEPALSHPNSQVRKRRIEMVMRAMDWAKEVGAPRLSVTSGRCPGGCPPLEGFKFLTESLNMLCEQAEILDLELSVEYEPGLLIERWRELKTLIEQVDHPRLGANLDLGHAHCAGEDPIAAIQGLAGRIWSIHLEDISAHKHFHLIPGQGNLNLQGALNALDQIQYMGPLTVELYTYANAIDDGDLEALKQAYDYLSTTLR